jgi:signal transduction histidine kinase
LLINLIDNAIKFTAPGGRVTVRATRLSGRAVVAVTDTGEGIASEKLPHVFDRFYQVDPARSSRGSGLGLSISRWIAQAHGGTIKVESAPGRGSTFIVEIPVKP